MPGKALVLGGGGITGIGWEIGMLAGLARRGADLSGADLVIGTSAGSVVGVDLRSGLDLDELYQAQLAPAYGELTARMGVLIMARYAKAVALARDPVSARRRLGAMALRTRTPSEAERRAVFEYRLPVRDWPAGALRVTAVDVRTGEFAVFDSGSGVDLLDAVGASCAVPGIWPPVTIGSNRYMDGGMRSVANADLAAGHDRVVVIAPLTQGFRHLAGLSGQLRRLEQGASAVLAVRPDQAALQAIGRNVLDPAKRAAAARAGYAQAATLSDRVAELWSSAPAAGPAGPGSA